MQKSIPLFYHIPKNSGTYVYHSLLTEVRKKYKNIDVRVIRVLDKQRTLAKIIVLGAIPPGPFSKAGRVRYDIDIENVTEQILNELSIVLVFIEASGFRCINTSLKILFNFLSKYVLEKFAIFREPFLREQSLYYYLKSDDSKHEFTHNKFRSHSFEEHILSPQLQDSWLIRALLNMPRDKPVQPILEEHFDLAYDTLKSFKIYPIEDTQELIKYILLKYFDVKQLDEITNLAYRNKSTYHQIKFNDLPTGTQKIFNQRKYWDKKLYEALLK